MSQMSTHLPRGEMTPSLITDHSLFVYQKCVSEESLNDIQTGDKPKTSYKKHYLKCLGVREESLKLLSVITIISIVISNYLHQS